MRNLISISLASIFIIGLYNLFYLGDVYPRGDFFFNFFYSAAIGVSRITV